MSGKGPESPRTLICIAFLCNLCNACMRVSAFSSFPTGSEVRRHRPFLVPRLPYQAPCDDRRFIRMRLLRRTPHACGISITNGGGGGV
jgi:hypothetical protein